MTIVYAKSSHNQNIKRNDEPNQLKSVPPNSKPAIITGERDFKKENNNNNDNIKQKRVP